MANNDFGSAAVDKLLPSINRSKQDNRPVVIMTCGISGAGKSTLSKGIIAASPNFVRLSGDTILYQRHGLYAINYPAEKYDAYLEETQGIIKVELARLLGAKQDIVLDLAFWNQSYREEYKAIIESNGGRWVLVFLDADRELLWKRVSERRARRDALRLEDRDGDSAFDISEKVFDMYCRGFERPEGEGEIVVKVV